MRWLLALVIFLVPIGAFANGLNTHLWISARAVERLPPGALRSLLERPELQPIFFAGTVFPDGGYAAGDDYGEIAHWEPFVQAYLAWVKRTYPAPYSEGEAARHVAFLFGVAAHGMEDQTFDSSFMRISREREMHVDTLIDGFDTATDTFIVALTGEHHPPGDFLPVSELVTVFAELGHTVRASKLEEGQDTVRFFVVPYAQGAAEDPARVAGYRMRYPWAYEHLLDPATPGSPPCQSVVVSRYLEELWRRLQSPAEDSPWLAGAFPADGSAGQPTDARTATSQVVLFFARGIDATGIVPEAITVHDVAGVAHPVEVSAWTRPMTNAVRVVPMRDWAPDTDYVVTIKAGLLTIDGRRLERALEVRFSTRAGGPVPHPAIPDGGARDAATDAPRQTDGGVPDAAGAAGSGAGAQPAARSDSGGCSAAPGAGPGSLVALLLAAVLRLRSRRSRP